MPRDRPAKPHSRAGRVVYIGRMFKLSPADALLEKLDRTESMTNIEVLALSEHVDYWDDIGSLPEPQNSGDPLKR